MYYSDDVWCNLVLHMMDWREYKERYLVDTQEGVGTLLIVRLSDLLNACIVRSKLTEMWVLMMLTTICQLLCILQCHTFCHPINFFLIIFISVIFICTISLTMNRDWFCSRHHSVVVQRVLMQQQLCDRIFHGLALRILCLHVRFNMFQYNSCFVLDGTSYRVPDSNILLWISYLSFYNTFANLKKQFG